MDTSDTVTRQFVLEDTGRFNKPEESEADEDSKEADNIENSDPSKKSKPQKLPEQIVVKDESEDSTTAASDMLRRYFNR